MRIFNKIKKQTKKSRQLLEEIYDQISDLSKKTDQGYYGTNKLLEDLQQKSNNAGKLDKNDIDRILDEIKNNSSDADINEIKSSVSSINAALNKIQIPAQPPADNSFFANIKAFFQDIKDSLLRIEKNTVGSDNNITVASLTDAFKKDLLKINAELEKEKARANEYEEKYKNLLESISEFEKAIKEKDEEICRLQAKIAELEGGSGTDDGGDGPYVDYDNKDFRVLKSNENKVIVTAESIESYINTVKDTSVIDTVFQNYGNENSYWKVYESYTKALKKFEPDEDEPDDTLYSFKDVFEKYLLKKLYTGITRSNNIKEGTLEYDLMMAVNSYIESCGFYTRDIAVGNKISDEDYDDTDQTGNGSIISEVSLYPYYLNYTDQSGDNIKIHTEGNIVIE